MPGLTKRQKEVADFISAFIEKHRHSPSYREIQKHFGFGSVGSVHKHIQMLIRKGVVSHDPHCSRSLSMNAHVFLTPSPAEVDVPLIGFISGKGPIEMFPKMQSVTLPSALVIEASSAYALRVRGDSLHEEQLCDGDVLVVETRTHPDPGDTVVALVAGARTVVRRYYLEGATIRFKSAVPSIRPLLFDSEHVDIQGVVVALLRVYK